MVTTRTIHTEVVNLLDYLLDADVAAYTNPVSYTSTRVSWHALNPAAPFLTNRGDPSLEDYKEWVAAGAYSAVLFDGSLLQMTYEVEGGVISGHRLAYIPCPFHVDPELVKEEPILDIIDVEAECNPVKMLLRSAVRFDFDPKAAKPGHPSAHMTINSPGCRIACVAPMHVGRFADFVFRHFYPDVWKAHSNYFSSGARRNVGNRTIAEEDRLYPHMAWQ